MSRLVADLAQLRQASAGSTMSAQRVLRLDRAREAEQIVAGLCPGRGKEIGGVGRRVGSGGEGAVPLRPPTRRGDGIGDLIRG